MLGKCITTVKSIKVCFPASILFTGNAYKFKVGSQSAALTWYTYVRQAAKEKPDQTVSLTNFANWPQEGSTPKPLLSFIAFSR